MGGPLVIIVLSLPLAPMDLADRRSRPHQNRVTWLHTRMRRSLSYRLFILYSRYNAQLQQPRPTTPSTLAPGKLLTGR